MIKFWLIEKVGFKYEENINISGIMKDDNTRATAVKFVANDEHYLLAGHDSGEVRMFDLRKPGLVLSKIEKFPEQIHRIKFSNQR